jgi:hypothetical protein
MEPGGCGLAESVVKVAAANARRTIAEVSMIVTIKFAWRGGQGIHLRSVGKNILVANLAREVGVN